MDGLIEGYGPTFRWFAWRPTRTRDRGWRWLRFVWKRKAYWNHRVIDGCLPSPFFETSVEKP